MKTLGRNGNKWLWPALAYTCLTLIALLMIFPFLWMISTSFKSMEEAFRYPPNMFPEHWHFENYRLLTKTLPVGRFFVNSIKITSLNVIGVLLSCSMAAFALARLNFPGRTLLFAAALITLMIPWQTTLIPVFILFQKLGWKDSHYPLWVPAFFGGGFAVFFLRQFFLSVPRDLYEAALVDGLTPGGVLFRIYLPLAKPALTTLGVFTFITSWNDLLSPLIYIDTLEKMPLTAGLSFLQTQYSSNWPIMMAGAVVSIIPILVIFYISQKVFVEGIATSGLKG